MLFILPIVGFHCFELVVGWILKGSFDSYAITWLGDDDNNAEGMDLNEIQWYSS